jgi:hypothetical protein
MLRKPSLQFLVGVGLALAGIALVTYSVNSAWEQRRYEAQGRVADGTVLDKREQRLQKSVRHLISYRFATADGRVMEDEGEVLSLTWETLDPGSPIRVEYAAGSPRINRPHDGPRNEWWERLVFVGIGMLFAAVGAGIAYIARKHAAAADATRVIATSPGRRGKLDSLSQTQLRKSAAMPNKNARVIIPLALAIWLGAIVLDQTDAPKAIYVALLVGFAVAIPLVVFYLMAEAGWSTLARRFRQIAPFNEAWRQCPTGYMALVNMDDPDYQSSKMGFISTLRVGTSAEALYLSMLFSKIPILGLFFPNVQIPWSTVRKARAFDAPGFFSANWNPGALVQVNYDPNYTGTFVELEIGEPPVFLQLPVSVLGDAIRRLPLSAQA